MADLEVGNESDWAAKAGKNINGGDDAQAGLLVANMGNISQMRARLTAISSTTFSVARLNAMTKNDLEYAIRLNDYPTSI